ncbi:MAG: phosphoribosyltransferase [Candidatus Heimdallarchaeota archaeon]|nr:phosphoribosyltransferase [Candidatus Heimdallarchaeota archaeon]MCK4878771.1 phosphoribosyltransferase [Candidatus Heimdallarchaeota archaeon]
MVDYEIVSWDQSYQMTFYLFEKITDDEFFPDVIVGIARGGWIPARLLADFYGNKRTANIKIEFYDNTSRVSDDPIITQEISEDVENKVVLVVDDVADSGKSLIAAVEHVKNKNPKEIRTATLYYKKHSILKPDYYIRETQSWVVYPWEYGEFVAYLYNQMRETMNVKEISKRLKDIGIPPSLVEAYFSLILKHENY